MSNIYCGGEFVPMTEKDGWWWCGGCGKRLWLADRTFTLPYERVPSGHGNQKDSVEVHRDPENSEEGGAGARSRRGTEAGGV